MAPEAADGLLQLLLFSTLTALRVTYTRFLACRAKCCLWPATEAAAVPGAAAAASAAVPVFSPCHFCRPMHLLLA
jgi:hypothetical protein